MPIRIPVAMMPHVPVARSRLGIPWRRHQPPRLPRRKQSRIRRLGICLSCRKRGDADGKHDSEYCETVHGMSFFYRSQMSRLEIATFAGANMFRARFGRGPHSRASSCATLPAFHSPTPRRVRMPRRFNSNAMARRLRAPAAGSSATMAARSPLTRRRALYGPRGRSGGLQVDAS
jgi:hypothetical protein